MTTPNTISCEQALRLLAAHLDSELDQPDEAAIAAHLARCRSCYARADFERLLRAEIARLGRVPLRPELEQRLQRLAADSRDP